MQVLIVHGQAELAALWRNHLIRAGARVELSPDTDAACAALDREPVDVMLLSLTLERGSALALADYAQFRRPNCRVVCVSNTRFFSDGSLFTHIRNARMLVPEDMPAADLTAVVEHCATH